MRPDATNDRESPGAGDGVAASRKNDALSLDVLMAGLYGDLRRLAQSYLGDPAGTPTLQATALVHETFLKMRHQRTPAWRDRGHFLAIAALCMRRIVLDTARRRAVRWRYAGETPSSASERAGDDTPVASLRQRRAVETLAVEELLAVGEALERLRRHDPELARVVELRFFVGLEHAEIAEQTGVSARTVKRRWSTARRWLYHVLCRKTNGGGAEGRRSRGVS